MVEGDPGPGHGRLGRAAHERPRLVRPPDFNMNLVICRMFGENPKPPVLLRGEEVRGV